MKTALTFRILSSLHDATIPFVCAITLCGPSVISAQGADRSKPQSTINVFKGGGEDRSEMGRRPPASLNALDLKKLAGMVGSEPGTVYARLTPKDPSVSSIAALVFVQPTIVEGGQNYASWGPPTSTNYLGSIGGLSLWLRPATGKKYLIDCAVESPSPGAHFAVTGPGGTAPMTVDAIPGGQHLSFVLDATDNKWRQFNITGVGTKKSNTLSTMTPVEWTLYYCEVTNL